MPWNIKALLGWLVGYVWPWNAYHVATAQLYFHDVMQARFEKKGAG